MKLNSLESVYQYYVKDVYRYLYSLSYDHHAAEDLVQETFYRAYLFLEDWKDERIKSWLFRVAHNAYVDYQRKASRSIVRDSVFFDQLIDRHTPEDILLQQQFENRNMEPVWFAVDTGPNDRFGDHDGIITDPVGFPSYPVWHHDDLTVTSYQEEKRGWFGKIVSSGGHYPSIDTYGDGELRNEHFIKSLRLLQEYELIANRVAPFVDVDASLAYVEQNGVHLYGAVVTGPVKELLTLREVSWVHDLRVGEVRLWNWTE